ncbi:MAG: sensor histidine kinase, partial [Methanogenium sp.]|nr:sensor histidine kinase [Methanogenium sp.]
KSAMIQEIHHRVKNNMQVISSILNMEIKKIQDPVVQFSFEKIRHRIQTIAFVHELAYQSGDFVHISVEALIKKITSNALAYQQSDHGTLSIEIEASDLTVDLDKSVPFGILANELVSNAVLHAFPEGRDGEITISFRVEKGNNIFEFADNGVGLPAEIDFEHPETPGLKLIHGLAKQLNGEVEVLEGPGTRFRFKFPTEQSRG